MDPPVKPEDDRIKFIMSVTPESIFDKKAKNEKVTVLTAYDYPFAKMLDEEGVDVILIGDSLGMVILGYENTLAVTMGDMVYHTRAVSRAVKNALVVADMPSGSYENETKALLNAKRLVDEAGAGAVKLEGGIQIEDQVRAILDGGIAVMGHVGMMPQSVKETGGYKVQGRNEQQAERITKDALLLDQLGAFAIVLDVYRPTCWPKARR